MSKYFLLWKLKFLMSQVSMLFNLIEKIHRFKKYNYLYEEKRSPSLLSEKCEKGPLFSEIKCPLPFLCAATD